jgi:hypothetical protein
MTLLTRADSSLQEPNIFSRSFYSRSCDQGLSPCDVRLKPERLQGSIPYWHLLQGSSFILAIIRELRTDV